MPSRADPLFGFGHAPVDRYTDADLARLHRWYARHARVLCFFNNMSMFPDAERFQAALKAAA